MNGVHETAPVRSSTEDVNELYCFSCGEVDVSSLVDPSSRHGVFEMERGSGTASQQVM